MNELSEQARERGEWAEWAVRVNEWLVKNAIVTIRNRPTVFDFEIEIDGIMMQKLGMGHWIFIELYRGF